MTKSSSYLRLSPGRHPRKVEQWIADQEIRYSELTPTSRALHERASAVMPGGDTRLGTFTHPYPLYLREGEGASIRDEDGRTLLDFSSPLTCIHGHGHPEIVRTINRQSERGTAWLGANATQVRFAELLCERVPCFERVRFTTSGTEATMLMIRIARAFSSRDLILKFDASAHGFYEGFELEILGDGTIGSAQGGVPQNAAANVVVGRFNDPDGARQLIEEHAERLAGVIVSPVAASEAGDGYLEATQEFLTTLRESTSAAGVLLLFDEVVTFRLSAGGAQAIYRIRPDLTALGKMIGGGLPVGAVGGREDVMAVTSPSRRARRSHADSARAPAWLGVSGSFNGNPATMAAGIVTLELLTPEAYDKLNLVGGQLREGFAKLAHENSLPLTVTGAGSVLSLNLDRELCDGDTDLFARLMNALRLGYVSRGVLAYQHFTPATVTSLEEVETCLSVTRDVLNDLEAVLA